MVKINYSPEQIEWLTITLEEHIQKEIKDSDCTAEEVCYLYDLRKSVAKAVKQGTELPDDALDILRQFRNFLQVHITQGSTIAKIRGWYTSPQYQDALKFNQYQLDMASGIINWVELHKNIANQSLN